jgi:5-(carboxyamino)imidazole ribonucleotide mutase
MGMALSSVERSVYCTATIRGFHCLHRIAGVSENVLVGIIMGSQSDWDTMKSAALMLDALGIPYEARVVSAHRTPDRMFEYAEQAAKRGLQVIIAGAGGAAHLPGMVAAKTLPALRAGAVAVTERHGFPLSIAQCRPAFVGTLAIGRRAPPTRRCWRRRSLATLPEVRRALERFRAERRDAVLPTRITRAGSGPVLTR